MSELGHYNNVAHLEVAWEFIITFLNYNPVKKEFKPDFIKALIDSAYKSIDEENDCSTAYAEAVNIRQTIFKKLGPLITRVVNAAKSLEITKEKVEDLKTVVRKINGTRAVPVSKLIIQAKASDKSTETKSDVALKEEHSASQKGYDDVTNHFSNLLSRLNSERNYIPNEEALKMENLFALLKDMKEANARINKTFVALSNARKKRNILLYEKNRGVYDVAMGIKIYVKSAYGASSKEYKQISKLKFTNKF